MKAKAYISAVFLAVLPMVLGLGACDKEKNLKDFTGTWVCTSLHDDDVITLTIGTKRTDVSVTVSCQDDRNASFYYLRNDQEWIIRGNTLYFKNPRGKYDNSTGFSMTKLSQDNMRLEFQGIVFADAMHISSYLFNRKSNQQ